MKYGPAAKPRHKLVGGRTNKVGSVRLKSIADGLKKRKAEAGSGQG